jgi:hypothetical protein
MEKEESEEWRPAFPEEEAENTPIPLGSNSDKPLSISSHSSYELSIDIDDGLFNSAELE